MKQSLRLIGLLVLVFALLGAAAGGSAAAGGDRVGPDVELGEAPRRDVPQDVVGLPLLKAMPVVVSRDAVVALYNTIYGPGDLVTLNWTGSVAGCNPGTTNLAHQQAVIDRVNYFRSLVGLPSVTLLGGTPTTQAQAAALMMSANNALSHSPPSSWICYSSDGATGASQSNIALGLNGVDAIDLYMDDPGAGNTAAGHRRWIFYPPQASVGTGDVDRTGTANPANDLYVFAPWTTRPATPLGIAWPPAGYVPYQNLPSASNRWSFSYPGAGFVAASVTMNGPSGSLPVTIETVATGYGDNTIVFRPTGVSYTQPLADTTYTVTVSGISGSDVPASFEYTVTVIDPVVASKPACTVTVVPATLSATGGSADVAASCTNSPTSYVWTANGTALSSVTTEAFTFTAAANSTTSAQTIMFQVVASNSAGSSSPATATLTVTPQSGTLSVKTTPVSGGITVDGAFKANGSWSGLVSTGSHTVSFGSIFGYTTPASQTVTVNSGQTTNVTANYTTGPVNGVCGTSNSGTFTSAPATNLCSAGSSTSVTGNGPWSWNCTGSYGGTTANCSANIKTWTVTPSAGSGGTISPNTAQTVNHGSTTSFTVTPNTGYTASVGGTCGGTLNGTTYTTNAINGGCTVSATFTANPINGICGASNGQTLTTAPTTDLCSAGTASSVSGTGPWTWSCAGANGGSTVNCSATILNSCTYIISPSAYGFASLGAFGSVAVTPSSSTCSWTATRNDSWITVTAGSNRTGNGTVSYSISSNTAEGSRTGTMIIGGQKFTVIQSGTNPYLDMVQKIYIGYYQRPADPGGLIYWADRLSRSGGNLNDIIEAYANSAESLELYGIIYKSNISFVVNDIYMALFNRPAEAGGLNYYVNGFNAGQFTAASIMLNVLNGAQNDDLVSVNNKRIAANLFTRTIDPDLDGNSFQATYAGDGDAIAGRNFLTLYASSVKVPTQAETTAYIKANIANPGDGILTP